MVVEKAIGAGSPHIKAVGVHGGDDWVADKGPAEVFPCVDTGLPCAAIPVLVCEGAIDGYADDIESVWTPGDGSGLGAEVAT